MYSSISWPGILIIIQLAVFPHFTNAQAGLVAEYFNDTELKNVVLKRVESRPYLNYFKATPAPGVNGEYFSARWTGLITSPLSGDFTFSVRADDGVRLWIDDKLVIDAWIEQEATNYNRSVLLEKDKQYKIKVEYYNSWRHSVFMLSWETPDDGFSVFGYNFFRTRKEIPASAFSLEKEKPLVTGESVGVPVQEVSVTQNEKNTPAAPADRGDNKIAKKPVVHGAVVRDSLKKSMPVSTIAVNELIEFKSVRFVLSKYELLEGSYAELDSIAAYLKRNARLKIKIIGHTDYEGNWTANYKLSQQRANAVADYFKSKGIAAERVFVEAMGSSKPLVHDEKPQNREANRRVEFMLIDEEH